MSAPYRIGLLGSGWISRTYVEALRQVEEGEAVAVDWRMRLHMRRSRGGVHLPLASAQ